MAKYAYRVAVTVNVDGSVTVEDDGRGIPTGIRAAFRGDGSRSIDS